MSAHWPLLALVGAGLTGCYAYLPVGTLEPRVGTRVAAEFTDQGVGTLAGSVGPNIMSLRGDVVLAESAAVVLSVTAVTDRFGREQFWKGEHVRVPRLAMERVRQREFSLGRSLLLTAALVGGSVAAWQVFQGGNRGGGLPPSHGGPSPQ